MTGPLNFVLHVVAGSFAAVAFVLLLVTGVIGVLELDIGPHPDPRPSERFMAERVSEYRAMHGQGHNF